jgi:hypothetical protein
LVSPRAALISLLSLWMISTGVFLGAPTPFQAAFHWPSPWVQIANRATARVTWFTH